MILAQNGDQAAYRKLLSEIQGWLMAYFQRRLKGAGADDLVQEALIALHTRRHTFDPSYPFMPWLATIAHHKWVDLVRKQVRASETMLDDNYQGTHEDTDPSIIKDLDGLLEKVPQAQAQVIRLVKIEGLSIEEAAKKTGQSVSSVKVNIHRGLKKLMDFVKKEPS